MLPESPLSLICIHITQLVCISGICKTILPKKTHFTWWYQIAISEVSASNQEMFHTFITNTEKNNYLKSLLSNLRAWCLLIKRDLGFAQKMCNTQRWPFAVSVHALWPAYVVHGQRLLQFPSTFLTGWGSKTICYV